MENFPPKQVVVPVDFSDFSLAAIDVALEITEDPIQVYVVHVLPDVQTRNPDLVWQEIDHLKREKHAKQELRNRLDSTKHAGVNVDVLFGDPGGQVAELASRISADLIVVPSHGRTGLQRLFIGSVAERVVRLAHCPVLVLRS